MSQNNQTVTPHKSVVKFIESSNFDNLEMIELFEGVLGYYDKHHLASTIIRYSPMVQKTKRRAGQTG